jgi:hypothetical protein
MKSVEDKKHDIFADLFIKGSLRQVSSADYELRFLNNEVY